MADRRVVMIRGGRINKYVDAITSGYFFFSL